MLRVVWLAAVFATAAGAQTIEGSAVNSVTNEPVSGVQVSIHGREKSANVTSDAQGSFRTDMMPPGEYRATYSKTGFDGPGGDDAAVKPFTLTSGSPSRLSVRMIPQAKVSGRVLDLNGDPIARISVMLISSRQGSTQSTDAYGRYEFNYVSAGSYRIRVHPSRQLKAPPPKGDERRGWLETYYPDVTDSRAAPRIEIYPGSDLQGQDIRLQTAAVHQLRGKVLDEHGSPAAHVTVTLDENALPVGHEESPTAVSNDEGEFQFEDLHDGLWRLSAKVDRGEVPLRAFAVERLSGHDVDRLQLRLAPPFTIHGNVITADSNSQTVVVLVPYGGGSGVPQAPAGADGNFTIAGVHPGRYVVRAIHSGTQVYLASVSLGERDVMAQESIDLSSGEVPITIIYKADGGNLHGKVENCGSATVLLVPQEPNLQNPTFWKTARCAEQGKYQFTNMRPGGYYVVALERAPGLEEMFTGFPIDQQLINQATTVTIRPKEAAEADLKVVRGQ
jgi:hypothetical protein